MAACAARFVRLAPGAVRRQRHRLHLYDNPEVDFSPSNLWAEDRTWVLCTDYDLWATKVAGPTSLVEALLYDDEIEAIRLPTVS